MQDPAPQPLNLAAPKARRGDDVMPLIDELSGQLDHLRAQLGSDNQRQTQLDEREAALRHREKTLGDNLEAAMQQSRRQREALAHRRREIGRRLRRYRAALQNQHTAAPAAGDVGKQRRALREVRDLLEQSETEMLRRWVRHRSIRTACSIVLTLIAIAVFSYHAAVHISSPTWGVSMVMQMPHAQWRHGMSSNAVLQQIIDRHPTLAANTGVLKQRLAAIRTTENKTTGELTIATFTDKPGEAIDLLGAVGESIVDATMPSGPFAAAGSKPRIVAPPMRSALPANTNRLQRTAELAAALTAATILLTLFSRLLLGRSRRVFNAEMREALSCLDDPPPSE